MTDPQDERTTASFPFIWGSATDIGRAREDNQDAMAAEPEAGLFLVVDGMGGHLGGDIAATMVAEDLPPMIENGLERLRSHRPRSIQRLVKNTVIKQSRLLHLEGDSETGRAGMGATMVLLLLTGGRAFIVNVGDSRLYRLRDGCLKQLTVDHSVISELLEAGHITPDEAKYHSEQGVVTQHMGMPEVVEPHVRSVALKTQDCFLLCSDGLTDLVEEDQICHVLTSEPDPQIACQRLIEAANKAGGFDNITAVVVRWMPDR